jgi:glutaredoxin-related protein
VPRLYVREEFVCGRDIVREMLQADEPTAKFGERALPTTDKTLA